ncbi:uncharacterized protein LY89DRAFT_732965 [Mollisia scopiformis]|uniref:Uncharacterized protein n=1 Tax=Mollisia scopiformis TaxID=149040 RepID=A0A194XET9_MOLSC|nr:uncharacterized protein LY89DRAFT_732965 [Mollisia scopiformis]KUJ18282.1 hypothetical protein LY89DRAFT_732965 [Mollisia scopiformis]
MDSQEEKVLTYRFSWDYEELHDFYNLVLAGSNDRHWIREVRIKGTTSEFDHKNMLDDAFIQLRQLRKVQVLDDKDMVGVNKYVRRDVSLRIMGLVMQALVQRANDYHFQRDSPRINTLKFERVYWPLFSPITRASKLAIFPFLQHLDLTFEPNPDLSPESEQSYWHEELGIVLKECSRLKTLTLRFGRPPVRMAQAYTKDEIILPPNFRTLVGNTHFRELEELTLERVVLDHEFAVDFFSMHANTLQVVNLISLWNGCDIAYSGSPIHEILIAMRLKDVQFRGKWYEYIPLGDSENVWFEPKVIWDDACRPNLTSMMRRELEILQKGGNPQARLPQASQPPIVRQTMWQNISKCCKKFFKEKIRRKRDDGLA